MEIRALFPGSKQIWSGYFLDYKACAKTLQCSELNSASGIYVTLNNLHPGLIARNPNRLTKSDKSTGRNDVISARWVLIDCDPVRPSGISSTDKELQAAKLVQVSIVDWITCHWPSVGLLPACSGNGWHVLVAAKSAGLLEYPAQKEFLKSINTMFGTPQVKIDTSVAEPHQLTKMYGTWARKGHSTHERPHRQSYLECPLPGIE